MGMDRPALMKVCLVVGVALCAALCPGPRALGQADGGPTVAELLEDFNFYVNVANLELAEANANALLDRGLTPVEFVGIVEDTATLEERFDRAVRRALAYPELEEEAAALLRLYEQGRLDRARNPEEIERNIELLTGNRRGQILAQRRLAQAGEYAVPQLLGAALTGDPRMSVEAQQVLVNMGQQAVRPLSVAVLHLEPSSQEQVARILGRISYGSSVPYLVEVAQGTGSDGVRAAVERALSNLGGPMPGEANVGALYRDLGERYYSESRSLTSFPDESHQLVWGWRGGAGLFAQGVRTEVYHEMMAMRHAERALELNPGDGAALSLWLAANLSREIDEPAGYENPLYGDDRRDAEYYAVAAGQDAMLSVLARALDDADTPLARRSISALGRTVGGGVAEPTAAGRLPLAEALNYPDRRVQYESAAVLGAATPTTFFPGSERVVPLLANAIRDASARYAVVLSREPERQQVLRDALEGAGYEVLPPAPRLSDIADSIAETPGVDLIVTDLTTESTEETLREVRSSTRLRATPVLAMVSTGGMVQIGGRFEDDPRTRLGRRGMTGTQVARAAGDLVRRAQGEPVSEEEARQYALRALDVLRDLAIGGGGVYEVSDATVPLLEALETTEGEVRLRVGDVLSAIGRQRAQTALVEAAMESGEARVRVAMMERAIDSAKRFGNLLEPRHVRWVAETAREGAGPVATTAAALVGALNLSNDDLVPLIVGGG